MISRGSTTADLGIIVFARAPVPGQAKTRLIPRLGAWRAARLQARLTTVALRTAHAVQGARVELHVTRRHRLFGNRFALEMQQGEGLGARMFHAFQKALRRHRLVILIGSDCPMLEPADLRRAARMLQGARDAVLAPAEDGGYALIALKRLRPRIFQHVDWGSDRVLRQTLANLDGARLRYGMLRTVWDVDRPEDLERFRLRRFSGGRRQGVRR
jgi:rSAM/selenodomain-associated transferase 1